MDAKFILAIPSVIDWLGGIEPAWSLLDPRDFDLLSPPTSRDRLPIQFANDFTPAEIQQSLIARNMLVLLRAAADGPGLKLTATGNLSRTVVAAMIERFNWPEQENWMMPLYHKIFNEPDFLPLHLIHGIARAAGLLRKHKGSMLITRAGQRMLKEENTRTLQADLLFHTLWRVDLSFFSRSSLDDWPQRDVGVVLWCLSVAATDWQTAESLTKTCTIPIPDIFNRQWDPSFHSMKAQILRTLKWFGLMEERDGEFQPGHLTPTRYFRKTALFDRLLTFDVRLRRSTAARH